MENRGESPLENFVVALGVAAGVVLGCVWFGARVALLVAGREGDVGLPAAVVAVKGLPGTVFEPRLAWPEPVRSVLPGPWVYWACTLLVFVVVGVVAGVGVRWWFGRWRVGPERRSRFGVPAQSGLASCRDLAPLVVGGPVSDRLLLGTVSGVLVATESRTAGAGQHGGRVSLVRRTAGVRSATRVGDRGAVALFGPSRCGKTTAAISGILGWDGPAILSSVKDDLLDATLRSREDRGVVKVFAPTHADSATWSPLRNARSYSGARAAARGLCDGAPRSGIDGGGDFWFLQVEILLSSLLWVAANTPGMGMGDVCEWVMSQCKDHAGGFATAVHLERLGNSPDPEVRDAACRVDAALGGVLAGEERLRGSTFATATAAVWPWTDPTVERSARSSEISLDWLVSGNNTLYLCGPLQDQRRFAPVFGGLLADMVDQVYTRAEQTGGPLVRPVLVVMDEAGNTPLRQLPEWASTVAGHGLQLVTIWQSKAQLDSIYGHADADTILTNHLTKIGFSGLSDRSSLDYLSFLVGDEQVVTRSVSRDGAGGRDRTVSEATSTMPIIAPAKLREMRPGHGVLIHGSLPPAYVETLNFRDRRTRHLLR